MVSRIRFGSIALLDHFDAADLALAIGKVQAWPLAIGKREMRVHKKRAEQMTVKRSWLSGPLQCVLGGFAILPIFAFNQIASGQAVPPPIVAIVSDGVESDLIARESITSLRQALAEQGLVDGEDFTLQTEYTGGFPEYLPDRIRSQIADGVRVIVSASNRATRAAAAETADVPIVMAPNIDAFAEGLVKIPDRPEGNITGISILEDDLWARKIEIMKQLVPDLTKVALFSEDFLNPQTRRRRAESRLQSLGMTVLSLGLRNSADLRPAFEEASNGGAQAVFLIEEPSLIDKNREMFAWNTSVFKLPAIATARDYTDVGLLVSVGPSVVDIQDRVAQYVSSLLQGVPVEQLPLELVGESGLSINGKAAKQLGIEIPATLLEAVDAGAK